MKSVTAVSYRGALPVLLTRVHGQSKALLALAEVLPVTFLIKISFAGILLGRHVLDSFITFRKNTIELTKRMAL